jgi:hypothetical protein
MKRSQGVLVMTWEVEQAGLAFVVALVVTGLELITTDYPMTPNFVLKSIWYYLYVVIYVPSRQSSF